MFRPHGLDVSKTYQVTFDNSGQTVTASGFDLQRDGIRMDIAQPLRSEQLLFEQPTSPTTERQRR